MRLLIYEPSYRRVEAALGGLGPELQVLVMADDGTVTQEGRPVSLAAMPPEAGWITIDVFFGPARGPYLAALTDSPALAWVQSGAAGFDNPVFKGFVERGARLTTSHGQALGMAEYVLWGVLDHLQRGPERRALQAAGEWKGVYYREIFGSRWLIVGFGAIGEALAVRARAFGAHVTGVRRSERPHPAADRIAPQKDLPRLLPEADVVVLACPLTADTRGLADTGFFAAMKPGSIFVNVGRGGLVDEAALLEALDKGLPEHALLDVFTAEPLPADSALWPHQRVTLTAHCSGWSSGNAPRNDALFVENVRRRLAGEPLLHEEAPEVVLAE